MLAREPAALARAVARSVEMKAEIVGEDEKEAGRRALLNLGHTFGHALEAETGLRRGALPHGEAVALGCALAFRFSAAQGLCAAGRRRARRGASSRPRACRPGWTRPASRSAPTRLIAHMAQDKKAEGGRLTFILARAIGDAFVAKTSDATPICSLPEERGRAPESV